MTFRNQSVIYYSIVSFQSLKYVKTFSVLETDALFSDGFALISTGLSFENGFQVKEKHPKIT